MSAMPFFHPMDLWFLSVDRSHKSVFTTIAQAGDSGPQAIPELSTLDARTQFIKVGPAIITMFANFSVLRKPLYAWK